MSPNVAVVGRSAGACLRRQSERLALRVKLEIVVSLSLSCSFSFFSLSFSLSRVVAPCTVNTDHTIRKHIHTERCVPQTRACIRLLHFSTHKVRTSSGSRAKFSASSDFRYSRGGDYARDCRAIVGIGTERDRSVGQWGGHAILSAEVFARFSRRHVCLL